MDFIVKEILKKENKPLIYISITGVVAVIVLNVLITLTNNLGSMQHIACILLLLIFGIIIFFIVEKIFSVYIYLLGDDYVAFERQFGKKNHKELTVNISQIKKMGRYENMEANHHIQATRYFIYRYMDKDLSYCEYEVDGKLYRFVFKPSERLVRILERKINNYGE